LVKISRTNRKVDYRGEPSPRGRFIVIATEGRVTEKQYFEFLRYTNVRLVVLPTGEDNCSSPEYVVERLNNYKKKFELRADDELWLVVDVDRWKCLPAVADEALRKKYKLAISNPCFEVWLLCHRQIPSQELKSCDDVKVALRKALGGSYNGSNLNSADFIESIDQATQTAQQLDTSPKNRWPVDTGTHVYKVVQSIRAS